jgi:hypothetical protein
MFNRMFKLIFKRCHALFTVLLFAMLLAPAAVATGAESGTQQVSTSMADVPALDERFTRLPDAVPLPPIPSDPVEALVSAVNTHSAGLGFPVDHGPAIRASGMSPEYAGRVALLMQAVNACDGTEAHRVDCQAAANDAAAGVLRAKNEPTSGDVDAWPSLYIDGDGGKDYYRYDYSVLLDRGGNDVYDNNAGGNLLDIQRGPKGSVALSNESAIGCEHPHLSRVLPLGTIAPPFDCVSDRQTVLIDQKSNSRASDDVYGVFKPPRTVDNSPLPPPLHRRVDGECTHDPVIRRIVLEGSGFQGNGLLIDDGGNDQYRSKTLAQGSGHIGIGELRDLGGGNDDYLTIRNSQGFALVATDSFPGTLGLLQDDGGNDQYHTYMPRPIDPNAARSGPPGAGGPGAGGVVDDTDHCDNLPRQVQGAALLGGAGRLLDEDGRDTYVGSPPNIQDFLPPAIQFRHSSQGFGCDGGIGTLEDKGADRDTYRGGPSNRKDGATISETRTDCFAAPGQGIFRDDGPSGRGGHKGRGQGEHRGGGDGNNESGGDNGDGTGGD